MNIPKNIKRYCKVCKSHTEQTVSLAKVTGRSKTHPMSYGSRIRMRKRGRDRGFGNKGRTSKGAVSSWKRTGAKVSKKQDLRFKCKNCGKSSVKHSTFRSKKLLFK